MGYKGRGLQLYVLTFKSRIPTKYTNSSTWHPETSNSRLRKRKLKNGLEDSEALPHPPQDPQRPREQSRNHQHTTTHGRPANHRDTPKPHPPPQPSDRNQVPNKIRNRQRLAFQQYSLIQPCLRKRRSKTTGRCGDATAIGARAGILWIWKGIVWRRGVNLG
ncbi:hypothetical protein P280DRAFT_231956 [Massarina eburnea CBS 473.64]|uniref:Uncharacterized protein n=1 Tax=Massarina eburnea CBS 473.64 TaxID=1395130 RepID=A0A6A6RJU1_9PLEO|nr:hypothetical protein P280DRAFT_231956 [Massarina eburnea CBS 473.64]